MFPIFLIRLKRYIYLFRCNNDLTSEDQALLKVKHQIVPERRCRESGHTSTKHLCTHGYRTLLQRLRGRYEAQVR